MAVQNSSASQVHFYSMDNGGTVTWNRSIAVWVKFDVRPTLLAQSIFQMGSTTGANTGCDFWVDATPAVNFDLSNGSTGGAVVKVTGRSAATTLSTGTWYHIATAYNSSATATTYLNGTSIGVIVTGLGTTGSVRTDLEATIGKNLDSSLWLRGAVAGISYHNVTLTSAEISEAYARRAAIVTTRGLVFAANLWARGEVGTGNALSSQNTFIDLVTNQAGIPLSSPTYLDDTILTF